MTIAIHAIYYGKIKLAFIGRAENAAKRHKLTPYGLFEHIENAQSLPLPEGDPMPGWHGPYKATVIDEVEP